MTPIQYTTPLTGRVEEVGGPVFMDEYVSGGGYDGLQKALTQMTPVEVVGLVKDANLCGRGGAGFPTGIKWGFVAQGDAADGGVKYLVCNGDEMEPGTFKDRYLIEYNPHILIEGMIIAAYAIQAEKAYVFLRGEYHYPKAQLTTAIQEAKDRGFLGDNICGSGFNLDLRIHSSGEVDTFAAKRLHCSMPWKANARNLGPNRHFRLQVVLGVDLRSLTTSRLSAMFQVL